MSDVIIRPIDIDRDAEGLAAMWNASDLQWPGSWTDGAPVTAEMVREWETDMRHLVTYVAEVDGVVVGYCSFSDEHGSHSGEGYLALLNVHPDYQKRSIGRRLIQATIERSAQEGFQRQTLGTWSANFKAVPTYKKTGHFWTPDTSVWMQSFVPGALQLSLAKPFFARHDWYATYLCDLTQGEDDERWEGLKVFTQRWQADGEALTIRIDREARAPVAVESDAVEVAAITEEIEPLAGSEIKIRWRVANKGAEPLSVHLHAMGDTGLQIDHRDAWTVAPGDTAERSATVKIADDASGSKEDGSAPAVRSLLRLGADEVELHSGLRVRKPLSVDTLPATLTLTPGAAAHGQQPTPQLQLHNELDRPLAVTVQLTPPDGLTVEETRHEATVPAKGYLALSLACRADEEGVYTLPVRITAEGISPVNETLTLLAIGAGGLVTHQQGNTARIETDALRITAQGKGGAIKVEHKAAELTLTELSPLLGPPYWPSEFQAQEFALSLEQRAGRVIARLVGEAKRAKGLALVLELAVSAAGLLTLDAHLENRTAQDQQRRLRLSMKKPDEEGSIALPLCGGLVQSHTAAYPVVENDAPRDPRNYDEPWMAWQRRDTQTTVAWNDMLGRIDLGWRLSLVSEELDVPAGGRSAIMRLMIHGTRGAGADAWQQGREAVLSWLGSSLPWDAEGGPSLPIRPPQWVTAKPQAMVTLDDEAAIEVLAESASVRSTDGVVQVTANEGMQVAETELSLKGLCRAQPWRRSLGVQVGQPGAYGGALHLHLTQGSHRAPFHILRLGTRAPVAVRAEERAGHTVWAIDNGRSRFVLAPDFGPSLIAWERSGSAEGENLLWSPFPQRGSLSWLYPWFGGIQPAIMPADSWCWEGYLYQEQVQAEPLAVTDAGIPWQGVRLAVRLQKKELHDLAFEFDWLTVGESDVLQVVHRVRNLRPTAQRVHMRSDIAFRLGGEPTDMVLHGQDVRREPTPWGTQIEGQRWGALSQPATGQAALVVGGQSDVFLLDAGQYGRLLGTTRELRLAGDETKELRYYVIVADGLERALAYLPLMDI